METNKLLFELEDYQKILNEADEIMKKLLEEHSKNLLSFKKIITTTKYLQEENEKLKEKIPIRIELENDIYLILILKDNKLEYELEYPRCNDLILCDRIQTIYKTLKIYQKMETENEKYIDITDNKHYAHDKYNNTLICNSRPLLSGIYLFVFNKNRFFVEFIENKITYYKDL